jgi:transcriptional regulator with XRE-family HTH domain
MARTAAHHLDDVTGRVLRRAPGADAVVTRILAHRKRQERAAAEIEQGIQQLAELGVTQRDIAALVGLSQPEVSRRLNGRRRSAEVANLRELVDRRSAGELSSRELVEAIASAVEPRRRPGRISAYDGSSSASREAAELMKLYRSGAISRDEYSDVRAAIARRQKSR